MNYPVAISQTPSIDTDSCCDTQSPHLRSLTVAYSHPSVHVTPERAPVPLVLFSPLYA